VNWRGFHALHTITSGDSIYSWSKAKVDKPVRKDFDGLVIYFWQKKRKDLERGGNDDQRVR
jgi:hypothetical protein